MAKKKYEPKYRKPALRPLIGHYGIVGVHTECESVPEISPRDFDILTESVSRRGLLKPILIDYDGMLVDGRARLRACHLLGIEIPDNQIEITEEPPESIADRNAASRNLTKCQYILKSVQVLAEEREEAKQRRRDGGVKGRANRWKWIELQDVPSDSTRRRNPKALETAAKKTGVSRDDLAAAERLLKRHPEIATDVENGVCTLDEACKKAGVRKRAKRRQMKKKKVLSFGNYADRPFVFADTGSRIRDDPTGVRCITCSKAMIHVHPHVDFQVIAYQRRTKWILRATDGSKCLRVPSCEMAKTMSVKWILNGRDAASQAITRELF